MAVTETEKRPSMRMARNKKGNVVLDPAEVSFTLLFLGMVAGVFPIVGLPSF